MLKVNEYGERQAKGNGKNLCFKGWETLVNKLSEDEQQWVDELFQRYGYAAPRVYDNYQTSWEY